MDLIDEDEILENLRQRRVTREIRAAAIEHLRRKAERNVPAAVLFFVLGFLNWIAYLWLERFFVRQPSSWSDLLLSVMPIMFIWLGYRSLVPHPLDRFLLLLATESILKGDETSVAGVNGPEEPQPR